MMTQPEQKNSKTARDYAAVLVAGILTGRPAQNYLIYC